MVVSATGKRNHLTGMQGGLRAGKASAAPSAWGAARPCGAAGPFLGWHPCVRKHRCETHSREGVCLRALDRKLVEAGLKGKNPCAANTPLSGSGFPAQCSTANWALAGSPLLALLASWARSCWYGSDAVPGGAGGFPDPTRGGNMFISAANTATPA